MPYLASSYDIVLVTGSRVAIENNPLLHAVNPAFLYEDIVTS